jgi:hypothetical protein
MSTKRNNWFAIVWSDLIVYRIGNVEEKSSSSSSLNYIQKFYDNRREIESTQKYAVFFWRKSLLARVKSIVLKVFRKSENPKLESVAEI